MSTNGNILNYVTTKIVTVIYIGKTLTRFSVWMDNYGIELTLTRSLVDFWIKNQLPVSTNKLNFLILMKKVIITN